MSKRLIKLLGEPIQNEDRKAAEVITPGMLLTIDSNGDLIKAATAGGYFTHMFALEREEMGLGIDDDYAVDDTVKVGVFAPGDRVLVLVPSGQNIQDGEYLEAGATAGTFRALAAGVRLMRSVEDLGLVNTLTRLRAEVVSAEA